MVWRFISTDSTVYAVMHAAECRCACDHFQTQPLCLIAEGKTRDLDSYEVELDRRVDLIGPSSSHCKHRGAPKQFEVGGRKLGFMDIRKWVNNLHVRDNSLEAKEDSTTSNIFHLVVSCGNLVASWRFRVACVFIGSDKSSLIRI